jgi:putative inorganic carbon (HCO3(-)) transporter
MEKNDTMNAMPKMFALLALSSAFIGWTRAGRARLAWNLQSTLLLALSGWLFVSTLRSPNSQEAQRVFLELFPKYLIIFFLTLNAIHERWGVRALCGTLVIAVCGLSWIALYRTLSAPDALQGLQRLKGIGLVEDPNDGAALAILAFPIAVAPVFRGSAQLAVRVVGLFCAATTAAVIWYSQSRGALMGAIGAILAFLGVRFVRRFRLWMLAVIVGLLSIPAMTSFGRIDSDAELSSRSREICWKAGLNMAFQHPLFGVGFNAYPMLYEEYATEPVIEKGYMTAHSAWVLVLAEAGFPGLFLFAALFFTVMRQAWQIRFEYPEYFCSMVGYGITITFLSHTYLIYIYILFALVTTARRVLGEPALALAGR